MKGLIAFMKGNKKLHTAIIAVTASISLVSCHSTKQLKVEEKVQAKAAVQIRKAENVLDNSVIDKMKLISTMFPNKRFTRQGSLGKKR